MRTFVHIFLTISPFAVILAKPCQSTFCNVNLEVYIAGAYNALVLIRRRAVCGMQPALRRYDWPTAQRQVTPLTRSEHAALLKQGTLAHSSVSTAHVTPSYPACTDGARTNQQPTEGVNRWQATASQRLARDYWVYHWSNNYRTVIMFTDTAPTLH